MDKCKWKREEMIERRAKEEEEESWVWIRKAKAGTTKLKKYKRLKAVDQS